MAFPATKVLSLQHKVRHIAFSLGTVCKCLSSTGTVPTCSYLCLKCSNLSKLQVKQTQRKATDKSPGKIATPEVAIQPLQCHFWLARLPVGCDRGQTCLSASTLDISLCSGLEAQQDSLLRNELRAEEEREGLKFRRGPHYIGYAGWRCWTAHKVASSSLPLDFL